MSRSHLTIIQIGGSLLTQADELRSAALAVAARRLRGERILVAASAIGGTEAMLEELDASSQSRREVLRRLRRRILTVACQFDDRHLVARIERRLGELVPPRLPSEGDESRRWAAERAVLARISTLLVAAALRAVGCDAQRFSADRLGLRAVGHPLEGRGVRALCRDGLELAARTAEVRVPVIPGTYALDGRGAPIHFGRHAGDYFATFVAGALEADRVELWKRVAAVMSTDPARATAVEPVADLSYGEAARLGAAGGPLHPRMFAPLCRHTPAVRIGRPGPRSTSGTYLHRLLPGRANWGRGPVVALVLDERFAASSSESILHLIGEGTLGRESLADQIGRWLAEAGLSLLGIERHTTGDSLEVRVAAGHAARAFEVLRTGLLPSQRSIAAQASS